MRDEQDCPGESVECSLELLDRRHVEVVRRLVENETVHAASREERDQRARALARATASLRRAGRGRRRGRTSRAVCARPPRSRHRPFVNAGSNGPVRELARAAGRPRRARRPGRDGACPRTKAVVPGSRRAVSSCRFRSDRRSQGGRPTTSSRSSGPSRNEPRSTTAPLESHDDIAAPSLRSEARAGAPTARTACRPCRAARCDRRSTSSRPSSSSSCDPGRSRAPPTAASAAAAPRAGPSRPRRRRTPPPAGATREPGSARTRVQPPANSVARCVHSSSSTTRSTVRSRKSRSCETTTTDPGRFLDETLEAIEPREIEIVRRLVEQKDVEARKQHAASWARAASPPDNAPSGASSGTLKPDLRADCARAGVEIATAQQQEPVERGGVTCRKPRLVFEPPRQARPCRQPQP